MGVLVKPLAELIADLTTILAESAYTGAKLHLSTNQFAPDPSNVLTDYSSGECTFGGYAAKSLTFSAPYIDTSGNVHADADATFIATSSATPQTAYTAYVTDSAGATLLFGWALDLPVPFNVSGDGVTLLIEMSIDDGTASQTP